MNIYFLIAGILCFILGLVHSILGEYLIFNNKRIRGNLVPTKIKTELKERHLRIIWATWHLASIFGWGLGTAIIIITVKQDEITTDISVLIIQSIIYTMCFASLLVLIGTKGKHPGWIVLLLIAIFLLIGN